MNSPAMHTVHCTYQIKGGRLELHVAGAFADIVLGVELTVGETSPSVMKNYYPNRTLFTSVRADNLGIVWDDAYQAAAAECWKRLKKYSNQIPELVVPHRPPGDPDPPFFDQIRVRELIRILAERDPRSARAIAGVVAERANVTVERVLESALRDVQREVGE